VNRQARFSGSERNRSPFGAAIIATAVAKAVLGALMAVLAVMAWQQWDDLENRQELNSSWTDVRDYAVFYPRSVGNDREELETGGDASTIAEAGDLYESLEESGALYVDAINYESGAPAEPFPPWPAKPIRVNTNFLERYPVMDESGVPIRVEESEQDWVVAVPSRFKSQEAAFTAYLQTLRTGGQGFDGAIQAYERMLGEAVPEPFTRQKVRIIWTAPGQDVFSFDSNVNPEGGNTIEDPVIEIMTPANSLVVDRLNAITGSLNTPLKVRVDGDSAAVFTGLVPTLRELGLDDNLQHLVTGHEAMDMETSRLRDDITGVALLAAGALLGVILLNAAMVIITAGRQRRTLAVRRLHGIGPVRSYRELLIFLGRTSTGQAVLAGVLVLLLVSLVLMPGAGSLLFPKLLAVIVGTVTVEALLVAVTAYAVERRNAVKRLKEL
jgi:hypothetical protein